LVAETIVDEYLRRDVNSRVRLTVSGGRGVMFVSGDVLSQADFDVSALVRRTLGSLGITDDIEPFVSLEPVAAERVHAARLPAELPVTVTGFASNETIEGLPRHVVAARRIARALSDLRDGDSDFFWLGPDAEVSIVENANASMRALLRVEHGTESLEKIRGLLKERLSGALDGAEIEVNPTGPCERRGLVCVSGASNRPQMLYGSGWPTTDRGIGHDPSSASKAGLWVARAAALRAIRNGASAALVQATYLPGEMKPHAFKIRDERGRDLSSIVPIENMSLERVTREWLRPGLNVDAARAGIVGDASLPWET
jgi:S-adenosylmethionine synthetase